MQNDELDELDLEHIQGGIPYEAGKEEAEKALEDMLKETMSGEEKEPQDSYSK